MFWVRIPANATDIFGFPITEKNPKPRGLIDFISLLPFCGILAIIHNDQVDANTIPH